MCWKSNFSPIVEEIPAFSGKQAVSCRHNWGYGANVSKAEFDPMLPRYIRITDISDQGDLIPTSLVSISHDAAARYLLDDGDLLFARSGATVGKSLLYQSRYGPCPALPIG